MLDVYASAACLTSLTDNYSMSLCFQMYGFVNSSDETVAFMNIKPVIFPDIYKTDRNTLLGADKTDSIAGNDVYCGPEKLLEWYVQATYMHFSPCETVALSWQWN
jgi:hypothetical protein